MNYTAVQKHLGTDIEIQIISGNIDTPKDIDELFTYCREFEEEFSRFKDTSTTSTLNEKKELQVSPRFLRLLNSSLFYKSLTHGYFSPFVNVASLGYSDSFEKGNFVATGDKRSEEIVSIQAQSVKLGGHTQLDFGGIGKGYLVDELTEILIQKGYTDFCINAGGDIAVKGKKADGNPWAIGIEDPFTGVDMGVFTCSNICINTSGSYKRKWEVGNKKHHHIVDPHTGDNNNVYVSVTVITHSCTHGDAFTKGIWHTPFDELAGYFEKQGFEGIVITKSGKVFASPGMIETYNFQKL